MNLTHKWATVASVEGGEILAKLDNDRVFISFPSDLPTSELQKILVDKEIQFDEWDVQYHAGESENETVAIWNA